MYFYYKLLLFSKVRHSMITLLLGVVTGILVSLAFFGSSYLSIRNEFINDALDTYQVSEAQAATYFKQILIDETGSSGLLGYMKFRAMEGDQYSNILVVNAIAVHAFNFTLKSTWAWLYWFLEVVLFSAPAALIGYDVGKRPFSESAKDWYDSGLKQSCAIPLESKDRLLTLLKANSLLEISELAVAEEGLRHPMIEIYAQRNNNKIGDILLTVQQTYRDKKEKIKRNMLGQWEVPEPDYGSFVNAVNRRLTE
jgi:hypothetical protein